VIPADHKWVSRAMVAAIITCRIAELNLCYPPVSDEKRGQIAAAKKQLAGKKA
jgi:hypothetical protein